jgi:hypothetical protein
LTTAQLLKLLLLHEFIMARAELIEIAAMNVAGRRCSSHQGTPQVAVICLSAIVMCDASKDIVPNFA